MMCAMAVNMPSSVLFACTGNGLRSPMAEAMLKHLHGHFIFVDSVGVRSGTLDPFAVEVMVELGMDISVHRPKKFGELVDTSFDLIISLSPEAQHRSVEMTRTAAVELEYWQTFDPSMTEGNRDMRLDAYRQVRDQLMERIEQRFPVMRIADT
jgi:protein-tyrosine-phosphatase